MSQRIAVFALAQPPQAQPPQAQPAQTRLPTPHRVRAYVDIAVVVAILAIANVIAHFTTAWANIATVPVMAIGLVLLVRARGLSWTELGLGREHWKSGARYALAAVALVGIVIAVGAMLPWTRPMFLNDRYATLSGAVVASMVIIPLQTVIPEELA
ncbi:MAG: CPBP family intramembrane metalloprotease, partial [Mycobacterium sp.]|nr:CPBP family intramembrane metalloprotease [Mycobacterium sp.]